MSATYVVTFDPQPTYYPGMLNGLRRMTLDEARENVVRAVRAHRRGIIVNSETCEVVTD